MNTRRLQVAGMGAIAFAGLTEAFLDSPDWQVAQAASPKAPPRPQERIPNVALKTHTGATVRFYDDLVRDKLVVINMMYASCSNTCPPTTQNLLRVQQMLAGRVGRDIFMYSITLRPEYDTQAELAHYAKLHGVKAPGWTFLTGGSREIRQLRLALGFYDPDPRVDGDETRHTGMVRIGNDAFQRWGSVPGMADPRQIVASILHLDLKRPPSAG